MIHTSSAHDGIGTQPAANETADASLDGPNAELIATRLRTNALRQDRAVGSRLPWFALEHAIGGDLGHVHAAHDVLNLPLTARPGLQGPLVLRSKRIAWRLIRSLPEAQSVWNGAVARLISFLLRQIEEQERAIGTLERHVADLEQRLPPDASAADDRRL